MVEYTGAMSADEVAAFLDETAVPLRLACRTPADRLWLVALWFSRDGETLRCATSADARVVEYLRAAPGVAFEVSTNEPPYRGVRASGTAGLAPDADLALLRSLLERYLGGTDSAFAERLLDDDREEVAIDLRPDRVYAWDFSNRMRDVTAGGA